MRVTQRECVCVCSLRYPACKALAPCCRLWLAPLYSNFSTSSHKWQDFFFKFLRIKYVIIFSINLSDTFLILRRTERDMIKYLYWSTRKVPFFLVRL